MAITSGQLRSAVAAALKVDAGSLPSYWNELIAEALLTSRHDIYSALLGRGFTQAQVDAWDLLDSWWRDQGTFWALTRGGALSAFDRTFIQAIDHRKELQSVLLYVGGVWVRPQTEPGTPGVPSTGGPSTSGDRVTFERFGPFDSRFPEGGDR